MNAEKLILLDADVVIHFTNANELALLTGFFKGRLLIHQAVIEELIVHKNSYIAVTNLLLFKQIQEYVIPSHLRSHVLKEYARIKREGADSGEAMCMAIARLDDKIIASSNTRDITAYCREYQIEYMGTLDILYKIYQSGQIDEAKFDYIIYKAEISSNLSSKTLEQYKRKNNLI